MTKPRRCVSVACASVFQSVSVGCTKRTDQLRRDNNNVPNVGASNWSRSLESDATVRADYALTTTTQLFDRTTCSWPRCSVDKDAEEEQSDWTAAVTSSTAVRRQCFSSDSRYVLHTHNTVPASSTVSAVSFFMAFSTFQLSLEFVN